MKKFYFVDFENVHNKGLDDKSLKDAECVYVFSTKNDTKIDVWKNSGVPFEFHIVEPGDQSADKLLVSYLGFKLAEKGKDCEYIIVSNDKGYDEIINFWKKKGYKVSCKNVTDGTANTRKATKKRDVKTNMRQNVNGRRESNKVKNKAAEREAQIRFLIQKKKLSYENALIQLILKAATKEQVKNGIMKLVPDANDVKLINELVHPLLSELPDK